MTRNRAALAIPAALVMLSGCGVAAAVTARTTTVSDLNANGTAADASPHVYVLPQPVVVPTAAAVPTAHPVPAPAPSDVVSVLTAGATQWLEIRSHSGVLLAKTTINPILGWMVNAGPGGAYWSQSGTEYELTTSGTVRKLGPVAARCQRGRDRAGRHLLRVCDQRPVQHRESQPDRGGAPWWFRRDHRRPLRQSQSAAG